MGQWQGQVCVITGAGSGIGAGLARHALRAGMRVIATDVDDRGLAALAREAPTSGVLTTRPLDVTDAGAVATLAEQVFAEHGQVHLLFNNAGVLVDGKSWERELRDWRWSLDVNVMGVVHGIRAFVPRMLQQGAPGRVINTASIGGLLGGGAFMGPYQATKHAVVALTESLYRELALEPAPVTASVLCPAEVATGIWESDRLRPEDQHNRLGTAAEQQFHDAVANSVAAGDTPDEFAAKVFAEIEAGRFWLIPETHFMPLFEQRAASIVGRTDPDTTPITALE